MPVPKSKFFTLPNGEKLELFYLGSLAVELGRSNDCIRKWEISGVIPKPIFKDNSGKRLYSREQIDAIVACAEKAKITQGKPLNQTSFSVDVHKVMGELNAKYMKK